MKAGVGRTKRLIGYILLYAMLFSLIEPFEIREASAAAQHRLARAAVNYLPDSQTATQAGIVIDGKEVRIETYGSAYFVIDKELEDGFGIIASGAGAVATGAGLVASGTAVDLILGLSNSFEMDAQKTPKLFSFRTSKMEGNCQQFRIITEASKGFDAWLLDASLQPMGSVTGLGGSNILRKTLSDYTSYYLLVCGDAGSAGKLLYSDIIDDYGNDFSEAGDLYFNRDYAIETEIAGDVDVLTFCASPAVSSYRLRIQSVVGSGGSFEVYDQNRRKLAQYSGTLEGQAVDLAFASDPGRRYYFRFSSNQSGRKILLQVAQSTTTYRITYHLHGGKNDRGNPSSYISTTSSFRLKKPTRSKYLFYGWYTDTTYRTRIYSIQGSLRRNLDLHAKWERVSPKSTSITKLKSKKKKQAVVKWNKMTGVKGYQLVYGTTKGLHKKIKKKLTKKTSLTIRGLKPGKTYYFKVCCYSRDSKGKNVYGKFSKVKKVKIKDTKKKPKKKSAVKKKSTAKKGTADQKKTSENKKQSSAATKKKSTKKSSAATKKTATKKTKQPTSAKKKSTAKKTSSAKKTATSKKTKQPTSAKKKTTAKKPSSVKKTATSKKSKQPTSAKKKSTAKKTVKKKKV